MMWHPRSSIGANAMWHSFNKLLGPHNTVPVGSAMAGMNRSLQSALLAVSASHLQSRQKRSLFTATFLNYFPHSYNCRCLLSGIVLLQFQYADSCTTIQHRYNFNNVSI
eukprot:2117365-Amphidinium_carterae.1